MSQCWRKWWKSVERDKSKSATGPLSGSEKLHFSFMTMNCLTSRQFSFNSQRLPHFCLSLHIHIPICVSVQAGSLPSQLCPCARAISLCLTFTAQLPIDRPPLHHFVRLTITHHEPKEEKGKILCFVLFCFKKKSLLFSHSSHLWGLRLICRNILNWSHMISSVQESVLLLQFKLLIAVNIFHIWWQNSTWQCR